MKKTAAIFTLAVIMVTSAPLFAQTSAPDTEKRAAKHDTVFNRCSDFFDTFNRPFRRQGNKQRFFTATAEWLKNINKY